MSTVVSIRVRILRRLIKMHFSTKWDLNNISWVRRDNTWQDHLASWAKRILKERKTRNLIQMYMRMNLRIYLIKEKLPKSKTPNSKDENKKKPPPSWKTKRKPKRNVLRIKRKRKMLSMISHLARLQMIWIYRIFSNSTMVKLRRSMSLEQLEELRTVQWAVLVDSVRN